MSSPVNYTQSLKLKIYDKYSRQALTSIFLFEFLSQAYVFDFLFLKLFENNHKK